MTLRVLLADDEHLIRGALAALLALEDDFEVAADGASVAEIAARASLAPGTVRNYLAAATAKLGAENRHAAARMARDRGWL